MFLSEKFIDKVFDKYSEEDKSIESELDEVVGKQPSLVAYLAQENFELLTEDEYGYLLFLSLFTFKVYQESGTVMKIATAEAFDRLEEKNWDILNAAPSGKFSRRIDPLYENYPQEDLLAFMEDAMTDDELPIITKEGREPMFIILKTVIDVLEECVIQETDN